MQYDMRGSVKKIFKPEQSKNLRRKIDGCFQARLQHVVARKVLRAHSHFEILYCVITRSLSTNERLGYMNFC